jgi:ribosomal protein S6
MKYLIVKEKEGDFVQVIVQTEGEMISHIQASFDYTEWSVISVSRLVIKGE